MHVVSVVGARPQFVKLAPMSEALQAAGARHTVIHTGQHYDHGMSDVFFADLRIPDPDYNLGVGSSSHGRQTGKMMIRLEEIIPGLDADWVLTYGDTNSTLAAALVAAKLHVPVAHLEAGLRSFNRMMPEEHNRILTDHSSDLLLAPTQLAVDNLATEGLADRTELVGDVMADVCLRVAASAGEPELPADLEAGADYLLATIHRAENTDDPERLQAIVAALQQQPVPVVLAAHPRLVARAAAAGIQLAGGAVIPVEPFGYPAMMAALRAARAVVTDSGGLQKEAYLLGTPCTTIRTETEWVETLDTGWNVLDPDLASAGEWSSRATPGGPRPALFGTGDAGERAAAALGAHRSGR